MFEKNKKNQSSAGLDQKPNLDGSLRSGGRSSASSGEIAVIGHSIRIDGDLRGDEDLRIEGNISGTIQLPNHSLTIGREGRIKANAYAKIITVDGEINGDLYGSEIVTIRATARVTGNVIATRVSVEEGAQFKGSIDMDPESVQAALGSVKGVEAGSSSRIGDAKQSSTSGSQPGVDKPVVVQSSSVGKNLKMDKSAS